MAISGFFYVFSTVTPTSGSFRVNTLPTSQISRSVSASKVNPLSPHPSRSTPLHSGERSISQPLVSWGRHTLTVHTILLARVILLGRSLASLHPPINTTTFWGTLYQSATGQLWSSYLDGTCNTSCSRHTIGSFISQSPSSHQHHYILGNALSVSHWSAVVVIP
ncbi:hypothetical protein J6590_012048 [Homalodisca vitripennis]|nr:hypothetical protein J6590_012048 [Homalodisca vitripennis]